MENGQTYFVKNHGTFKRGHRLVDIDSIPSHRIIMLFIEQLNDRDMLCNYICFPPNTLSNYI